MSSKLIIVVQQETLRERPRIHKLSKILESLNLRFEVWKFGDQQNETFFGIRIRNLIGAGWRRRPAILRYAAWMVMVLLNAFRERKTARFFAVGFDSALPVSLISVRKPALIFDNIDNISLSYRWPQGLRLIFRVFERWVSQRAQFHIIPTRARWSRSDPNLRVVTNTPSKEILAEAVILAKQRNFRPGPELTIYLNGWLSRTRGIRTLVLALQKTKEKRLQIRVLVAGRPSCEDADRLLSMEGVEALGMLTNAEALATYYRSHFAYVYYDPSVEGNRLAASQKWTDCWATQTPFVSNVEIETLDEYVKHDACFVSPYEDANGLAALLESLAHDRSPLERIRANLGRMNFRYWDEEMRRIVEDWLALDQSTQRR